MFRKGAFVALVLLVVCSEQAGAQAFDLLFFNGQRQGFTVGAGVGVGPSYIHSEAGERSDDVFRIGPGLDFRFGLAPTNNLQFFTGAKMCMCYWDKIGETYGDYFDAMRGDDLKAVGAIIAFPFAIGIIPMMGSHTVFGLVGATYYLNEAAPSYFFEGTVGVGIVPDEFGKDTRGGTGFSVGAGYEFVPHFNIRGDILYGHGVDEPMGYRTYEESATGVTLLVTMNVIAY